MFPFTARIAPTGLAPTRRDWLSLGLTALAASALSGKPNRVRLPRRAKSVLVVFAGGGQSQIDMWDPKPNAPEEVRGEFQSIPTALPGIRLCEHLPKVAKLANKYRIVRSMTHDDVDHGSACYLALTGQFHPRKSSNPPARPTDFPTLGAVLQRVRPSDRLPHASFQVNGPLRVPLIPTPGRNAGFLGRSLDPIEIGDPESALEFVEGLTLPPELTPDRFQARQRLCEQLGLRGGQQSEQAALNASTKSALELLDNRAVRAAFDLSQESPRVRDRYGRYRSGQACLLARRLVEAGVPWVTAFFNHNIRGQDDAPHESDAYGWDTHNDVFDALKTHLLPRFDQTFSALLEDLDQRGLLKDTLVVCMGEFGRAPRVAREASFQGTSPGRKHWAACYSVVFAGAGISGGVYGSSDRQGAYPQSDPVTPGDLTATLFEALGIDPSGHYSDSEARPYRIATGDPIRGLFDSDSSPRLPR
jgi:hypothetical protein